MVQNCVLILRSYGCLALYFRECILFFHPMISIQMGFPIKGISSTAGDADDEKKHSTYTLTDRRNDGVGAPWLQRTDSRRKEGRLRPRRPPLLLKLIHVSGILPPLAVFLSTSPLLGRGAFLFEVFR